jgi:hypothetical protein
MRQLTYLLLDAYSKETGGQEAMVVTREVLRKKGGIAATAPDPGLGLLHQLATAQHTSVEDVLYRFGLFLMLDPVVEFALPEVFEQCQGARALLVERVGQLQHLLLQDLSGTEAVHVETVQCASDLLEIRCEAPFGAPVFCHLLIGIITGAGLRFNTALHHQELACQAQGAPLCRIAVRFTVSARAGSVGTPLERNKASLDPPMMRQSYPLPKGEPAWSGAMPGYPEASEPEEDFVVLRLLAVRTASAPSSRDAAAAPGLTLFEIQAALARRPFTASYAHAGPLLHALNRLVAKGDVAWSPLLRSFPGNQPGKHASQEQPSESAVQRCYWITEEGKRRLEALERSGPRF